MTDPQTSGLQAWDEEGAALVAREPASGQGGLPPPMRHGKQPQDTAAGCRVRAEADLAQSQRMDTVHGRQRFEHSAASWTARGDLLARLDASRAARDAIAGD